MSSSPLTFAAEPRYRRAQIADARFGTGTREVWLRKAREFATTLSKYVKGQELPGTILQDRLVKYLENFPNRKGEPVSVNYIGLPGVGKSAMVEHLRRLGFTVVHFDAQKYVKGYADFNYDVSTALAEFEKNGQPVVLVVEEVDKVAEIGENGQPETSSVIGTLNQILSDGIISRAGKTLNMSNVMVLTTMNFSPVEITNFSREVLGVEKSFYDFNVEDFGRFGDWVKTSPAAAYKILARMFRSNTVGRFAPNTVLMSPLDLETYREIVKTIVTQTVMRTTRGPAAAKWLNVEVDQAFIDFLTTETLYAPSGARQTVLGSGALTEQAINIGTKAIDPKDDATVDRPRRIHLGVDPQGKGALITVTPRVQVGKEWRDRPAFVVRAPYRQEARLFTEPKEIMGVKPKYASSGGGKPARVTNKMVLETRFPKSVDLTEGLVEKIGQKLLGQNEVAAIVQDDLNRYLGRAGPSTKEPSFRVLAGFPGIGKSELVRITAEALNLPVVRVNMQQYSADAQSSVASFFDAVTLEIAKLRAQGIERFVFQVEEFDKVFEIDPKGNLKNRPIIATLKDLMNDGVATHFSKSAGSAPVMQTIDIRSAFTFVTMNFSVDRFNFEADPRLTTVEDVLKSFEKLKSSPMMVKSVLGSMFLPETVSRLMARISIVKPPDRTEYGQIVHNQVDVVSRQRLLDKAGRNVARTQLETTKAYEDYLFSETVIPSEGARNTAVGASGRIATDLEDALKKLPRNRTFATAPLIIKLNYDPAQTSVLATVRLESEPAAAPLEVLNKRVGLNFPPIVKLGRVSEKRMLTSAHEFGHAFLSARLGLRFESVVVVSPKPGTGGYVKFRGSDAVGKDMIAHLYAIVGSRALERIVSSPDPRAMPSVLSIGAGSSDDIKQATMKIFNLLYEWGFDPGGGLIDRNFIRGPAKYADVASVPAVVAEQMSRVLRDLENFMVDDLIKSQSMEWYVDRIAKLARAGAMNEEEFYNLVGYSFPKDDNRANLGDDAYFRELFKASIKARPEDMARVQKLTTGEEKLSVTDRLDRYVGVFVDSVQRHLHETSEGEALSVAAVRPATECGSFLKRASSAP